MFFYFPVVKISRMTSVSANVVYHVGNTKIQFSLEFQKGIIEFSLREFIGNWRRFLKTVPQSRLPLFSPTKTPFEFFPAFQNFAIFQEIVP